MNVSEKLNGIIDVKKALCYTDENDGNFYHYQLFENGE
jgi:hypothetical protein